MQGSSSDELHGTHDGYPSRSFNYWRARYNTFLAISIARFFLREFHSVVGEKWGGLVRLTCQLRRDVHWWTHVPIQSNGKPIHKPVETAYLHTDSSG
jgi:hypothetical protein